MEALKKKKRQDETWLATKIDDFLSFIPRSKLRYVFASFF
jgi:hypothetical protein